MKTEKDIKPIINIGLYFEITGSTVYGGPEDVGYTHYECALPIDGVSEMNTLSNWAMKQLADTAEACGVPKEQVRFITRQEYLQ